MKSRILLALCLLMTGLSASAADCSKEFASGEAPKFVNHSLASHATMVCHTEYAAMDSGITRTPLWSAEHLTAEHVHMARNLKRHDDFHPEDAVAPQDRSELDDYRHSGYDRGHMSPSGDFSTQQAQDESFSLGNIVPQNSWNNQNLWAGIEMAVRNLAIDQGDLYIITGPIFDGADHKVLRGRVAVPDKLFKIVYDKRLNRAGAYLADNAQTWEYKVVSVSEIERLTGIDFFPGMKSSIKDNPMILPAPEKRNGNHQFTSTSRVHEVHEASWVTSRLLQGMFHSHYRY